VEYQLPKEFSLRLYELLFDTHLYHCRQSGLTHTN